MNRAACYRLFTVAAVAVGVVIPSSSPAAAVNAPLAAPFEYNGTTGADGVPQTWTVPPGVKSITVDVYGAQGGGFLNAFEDRGGLGGHARATFTVTPGEMLQVNVGGRGGAIGVETSPGHTAFCRGFNGANPLAGPGGFNGGGPGGDGPCPGAGGGGASDLRRGTGTLGERLIVAGGGGGGANGCPEQICQGGGGGGGYVGQPGTNTFGGTPGGGGTQTAGGAGGWPGGEGALGHGGPGETSTAQFSSPGVGLGGGGGGGGWYGGGGGSADPAAGGGGASGYVHSSASSVTNETAVHSGDGKVVITYMPHPVPTEKDECRNGAWATYVDDDGAAFRNQGQCISFVVSRRPS